jgi:phosphatidylserine/phosphatidylglycerophosphate/cardiolipin synthase-like enzyme
MRFVLFFLFALNLSATEIYFSPSKECKIELIKRIDESKKSIHFAIYSFTDKDILESLLNAKSRNVDIQCVFDIVQSKGTYSLTKALESNFNCKPKKGKGRGVMHNKYAIFDNEEIILGSFNWTKNATENNYENCLFTKEKNVIDKVQENFKTIKNSK